MKKWRTPIIIIIFALILLVVPISLNQKIKNLMWQILKPESLALRHSIGVTFPFIKSTIDIPDIIKQNSNLVSENLELQSRLAELLEVQNENEILKKELGFMQTQNLDTTVAAAIIGRSSDYLKSFTLDKGITNGVKNGDGVISQGILIGTVSEARQNNSDVTLITDANSLVPVILQNSRGTGLLHGGLGGLIVSDIPLNIAIQKDENVLTSGLGGNIPEGILIGKTTNITSRQGEIFQQASVSSPIDLSRLVVAFVIIRND